MGWQRSLSTREGGNGMARPAVSPRILHSFSSSSSQLGAGGELWSAITGMPRPSTVTSPGETGSQIAGATWIRLTGLNHSSTFMLASAG